MPNECQSSISSIIKNHSSNIDPLFTPIETAQYLGVTEKTLAVWRCTGRYKISFIKVGRLVKYRKSVLDEFLLKRTHGGED